MFALRGLAVSIAIFAVLYIGLSAAICAFWPALWIFERRQSARGWAGVLFGLRLLPFTVAVIATLALAVPSFILLEPRGADEPMGAVLALLSSCGAIAIAAGVWNAIAAWIRAKRTVARWSRQGRFTTRTGSTVQVSVLPSAAAPPLIAAGVVRPSVWLSRSAEHVLTPRELEAALRHEFAHVHRRDNLSKLTLRLVAFPGMAALENAWRQAAEMAADDAAVSNASEALDLAAAVIKLSRMAPHSAPELTTALIDSPVECLSARVARLLAWREPPPAKARSLLYGWCMAGIVLAALSVTYHALLIQAHAATEWLVR